MALSRAKSAPSFPLLALAGMELRMAQRSALFRVALAGAFALGFSAGDTPGRGVGLSAYATGEAAWQYLGFVAVIWMSLVAVRETALRTDILVSSKPQPNESLGFTKFLGGYAQLLLMLFAMFVGAAASRMYSGAGLLGIEVYLQQYFRSAGILFFAAAASYTLALLFDSPIAGVLIGLYWLLTLSGKAFLAKFYFPAYTQNLTAYLALGAALLCVALWLHRRSRRGAAPPSPWVRFGAPIFLLLAGWQLASVIQNGHDPQVKLHPIMERMSEQDTDMGALAAGFLLPDQNGRLTSLSDFKGKILVIALWTPHEPDSILLLDYLNEIQAKYGARGVQPIALCMSEDEGAASTFARGERLQYPAVADWGTYNAPIKTEISPLATAYRADLLPKVVVTDRRRRIRGMLTGVSSYDASLEQLIQNRLAAEPQ